MSLPTQVSTASGNRELIPRDTRHPHHPVWFSWPEQRCCGYSSRPLGGMIAASLMSESFLPLPTHTQFHMLRSPMGKAAGGLLSRIRPWPRPPTSPNPMCLPPPEPQEARAGRLDPCRNWGIAGPGRRPHRPGRTGDRRGPLASPAVEGGASKGTCPRPPRARRPGRRSGAGPPSRRRGR